MDYILEESFDGYIKEKYSTKYTGQFIQHLYYYLDELKRIDPYAIVYIYYDNMSSRVLIHSYRGNNEFVHVRIKEMKKFEKYTIIDNNEAINMASLFGSLLYISDNLRMDMKNKRATLRKDKDVLVITIEQIGGVK